MTLTERINQIKSLQKDECWYITKQTLSFKDLCFAAKIIEDFKQEQSQVSFDTFFNAKAITYGITQNYRMTNNCYYIGLLNKNGAQYKDATLTEAYFAIKASCNGDFNKTELYKELIISQIEKVFISNPIDEENKGARKKYKINPAFYLAKVLLGLGDVTGDYSITLSEFYRFVGTSFEYSFYISTIELIIEQRKNEQLNNNLSYIDNYYDELQNITIDNFSSNRIHLLLANLPYFEISSGKISFVKDFTKKMRLKLALYECNLSDDYFTVEFLNSNKRFLTTTIKNTKKNFPFPTQNRIFFGCPGTGKSRAIENQTKGKSHVKVTFHPEYDYASFVGTYKPFTDKDKKITYQFVPQAFAKIYVEAWKNLDKPYYLVIEEINRGNCAAIFGDIFQLLDRDNEGFSQYFINAETDLCQYLEQELAEREYKTHIQNIYFNKNGIMPNKPLELLCLPPNLSLLATMNTSDQSLFPMDSAFKRRWEWQYVPIDYADAEKQLIEISTKTGEKRTYSWASFLKIINEKIYKITESEDKQMGNRFVSMPEIEGRQVITEEVLKNKIMFYLWFDVFKNEDSKDKSNYIFRKSANETFKYADLFDKETGTETLLAFFAYNGIEKINN